MIYFQRAHKEFPGRHSHQPMLATSLVRSGEDPWDYRTRPVRKDKYRIQVRMEVSNAQYVRCQGPSDTDS
jgi:hypothetical protein